MIWTFLAFAHFRESGDGLTLVWSSGIALREVFDLARTYGPLAVALLGFAAHSESSFAQNLPGPADPGRLEDRFDKPQTPRATEELELRAPESRVDQPRQGGFEFQLLKLRIEGGTVYEPASMIPIYQEFLDKPAGLDELREIARRITRKYRRDGYILTRAIVPAQEITDGIAQIQVIEGYIDDVRFNLPETVGIQGADLLSRYAAKIRESRPLCARDLERYLLLASDLPGLEVRSVLRPSDNLVGAAALDLQLIHTPLSGSISYDNRGSRFVGPEQSLTSVYVNSILGQSDQTVLFLALARKRDELFFAELRHSFSLGTEGVTLTFAGSRSDSEPGFSLDILDVQSTGTKFSALVTYLAVRSRARNITFGSGFELRSVSTDLLGDRLSRDRLRVLRASASIDFVDRYRGVSLLALEVSQGLNVLDARGANDPNISRQDGKAKFTKSAFPDNGFRQFPAISASSYRLPDSTHSTLCYR